MSDFAIGFLCGAFFVCVASAATLFAAVKWQKHVELHEREA